MSLRSGRRWSLTKTALLASLASLLAYSCAPQPRPTWRPPLPDRRSLPEVRVTPADAGSPAAPDAGSPPAFPRGSLLSAVSEGDRIADLAVLAQEDRLLVASVTYFADGGGLASAKGTPRRGPSKKTPPPASASKQGATVTVRTLDAAGETSGTANVISVKAESIGGVSLAGGASSREDTAIAWVGKDAGVGQVFLTRLGKNGEKQTQKMVTHSKEGCSDVALVRQKDGYVVAYVEQRDGGAAVVAARIGKDLQRVGAERVVAEVRGDAYEVRMLARGDDIVVAWGEARQYPELYEILATRLSPSDLSPLAQAVRVAHGALRDRGLEMAAFGERIALGFIEETVLPAGTSSRTAILVDLDMSGTVTPELRRVSLAADPSSLAFECDRLCRVVVGAAEADDLALFGFFYDGSAATPAARLATIPGVSTEDTNPVVLRDWLFFAEDNLHGAGRIRKVKLTWR